MQTFFLGVDLGKRRDATAMVVVERLEKRVTGMDWIRYAHTIESRYLHTVRHIERAVLGTSYGEIVRRVAELAKRLKVLGTCTVVVDATGVGAPVVDLLREAGMGCDVVAVTITGGDEARRLRGGFTVPKKDLMAGLQVALEEGILRIAEGLREWPRMVEELASVRVLVSGSGHVRYEAPEPGHDDLVLAMALAWWRARMPEIGEKGRRLV